MSAQPLQIGVIGYGYWGPNLVRNFTICPQTRVAAVAEQDERRRAAVNQLYPWVKTVTDPAEIFADPAIDAVAIVTPMATHHPLARTALAAGKHVLVEKPLAGTAAHAEELTSLAAARGLTLMVDHTFVFTGAVNKIKEYVASGMLGRILYFDSVRVNLGLFQRDSNVIWDLAPHDLSILDYVVDREPRWVAATGARHYGPNENLAYVTIGFDDEMMAHFHFNWIAPVKVRRILIGGTERMLVYDDLEPSEKVKLYDHGVSVSSPPVGEGAYELLVSYRSGDVLSPKLDGTEALRRVVEEFAAAIREGRPARTDGRAGTRVVRLLEAAQASLREAGARVML